MIMAIHMGMGTGMVMGTTIMSRKISTAPLRSALS